MECNFKIERDPHIKGYTVISNASNGKILSLAAKGLLKELLSLPPDWYLSVDGLAHNLKESKRVIVSILKELEDNGYLIKEKRFRQSETCKRMVYTYFYTIIENPYNEHLQNEHLQNEDIQNEDIQNEDIQNDGVIINNKEINKDNKDNNKEINNNKERVSNDTHAQARPKKPATRIDYDAILAFFNEQMEINGANIQKIDEISDNEKRWIRARLAKQKYGIEDIKKAIQKAAVSDFMNGRCRNSDWIADLGWIVKTEEHLRNVLKGNYDNKEIVKSINTPNYGTSRRDEEELRRRAEADAVPTTEIFEVQDEDGNTEIVEIEHKPIVRRTGEITATLEDVTMLFVQLGYDANFAQPFYDYYASQGWRKANGQKITRLDTLIRAWMEREREIQLEKLTKKEKELNYADAGYEERTQRFIDHISQLYATRAGVPDNMESDETVDILPF